MHELQRLTTEYDTAEDRIRLIGADSNEQTVLLWLTQRLLNHLVAYLCQWLEQHGIPGDAAMALPEHHRELAQGFAQQAARLRQIPELPVLSHSSEATWRVASIIVASSPSAVGLTLLGEAGQATTLTLAPLAVRQWLGIVYDLYRTAGWPLSIWPAWMMEAPLASQASSALSLH